MDRRGRRLASGWLPLLSRAVRALNRNDLPERIEPQVGRAGAAEDAPLVGAWADSGSDSGGRAWALVVWRRPDLVVVDGRRAIPLWRHCRLAGLVGSRALAAQRGFESAASVPHGPRNQPFELAQQVLMDLGLVGPRPPHCEP